MYKDRINDEIAKPTPSMQTTAESHRKQPFIIFIIVIWTLNLMVTNAMVIRGRVVRLCTTSTDEVTTILNQAIDKNIYTLCSMFFWYNFSEYGQILEKIV